MRKITNYDVIIPHKKKKNNSSIIHFYTTKQSFLLNYIIKHQVMPTLSIPQKPLYNNTYPKPLGTPSKKKP